METWLVVFILGELAFIVGIIWIITHYRQRRSEQRAQERARLLERVGTGREVVEFLETEPGRRFLRLVALERPDPRRVVLRAVAAGVFLLLIGFGFLLLVHFGIPDDEAFVIPGALSVVAGVGVLISAAVSHLLGRRWGLFSHGQDEPAAVGRVKLPG